MTIIVKGLSVRQPWAGFIASGMKTVEWRSWKTQYRGPLLICSTARPDPLLRDLCKDMPEENGVACGFVTLVDCVPFTRQHLRAAMLLDDDEDPEVVPDDEINGYAWILKQAALIDPFPVKGKQGLMNVEIPDGIGRDLEKVYNFRNRRF